MGVVNLSILIEKLKKALSGEYVKKTDKASTSAFGVVKVGNNISVSSGKISVPVASDSSAGVVKVGSGLAIEDGTLSVTASGGMSATLLKEGSASLSDNYTEVTLEDDYDKYTMLVVCVGNNGKNSTGNAYFFVPWLSLGALQDNNSNASAWTVSIRAVVVDSEVVKNKLNVKTNTTAQAWSIYGIK